MRRGLSNHCLQLALVLRPLIRFYTKCCDTQVSESQCNVHFGCFPSNVVYYFAGGSCSYDYNRSDELFGPKAAGAPHGGLAQNGHRQPPSRQDLKILRRLELYKAHTCKPLFSFLVFLVLQILRLPFILPRNA
jgi:hypothetical protein